MLFHEYALTPQIFEKSYLEQDTSLPIYLKFFLINLRNSGLLANMNNSEWLKIVNKYKSELSPKLRDEISKILEELSKRNRIVTHATLMKESLNEELDWINLALKEEELKPYQAVFFTGKFEEKHEKMTTLEKYMENHLVCNEDAPLLYQTLENMEKYLTDFLAYAKRLIIIDPYFTFGSDDDKTLILFSELFAKRRGNRMKNRKIFIHIFYNKKDWNHDPDTPEYQQKWSKLFQKIYEKYGHDIRLDIWNDRNMHDRYMITDQGGISSSNGFGVFASRKPHWSLLKTDEVREQLNYFIPNVNPKLKGKLIHSITKESASTITIVKDGLLGIIENIQETSHGKYGYIKTETEAYNFRTSKLNKISKEIKIGMNVEFRLKITGEEKIADIIKIVS
jgi:hypothetical protein